MTAAVLNLDALAFVASARDASAAAVWTRRPASAASLWRHPMLQHLLISEDDSVRSLPVSWPLLTLRRGPGFVLIDDGRRSATRRQFRLQAELATALTTGAVGRPQPLTGSVRAEVAALVELDLAVATATHWVALPLLPRRLVQPVEILHESI